MEKKGTLLKNCFLALSGSDRILKKDMLVLKDKIALIRENITFPFDENTIGKITDNLQNNSGDLFPVEKGDLEIIDLKGKHVFPGGIDPHVHFDDPGYTDREDFYHGTSASVSGGITTVIDMPCTSVPPVTDNKALEIKYSVVSKKAVADYGFFGGISGHTVQDGFPENALSLKGLVMGYKTYMISGMDTFPRITHFQYSKVAQWSETEKQIILVHAEDYDFIDHATHFYRERGDRPSYYTSSRPEIAEILAVSAIKQIKRQYGGDFHIVHVGTAEAADLLVNTGITFETAPHYLEFDSDDFDSLGSPLKIAPPVKSRGNKKRLWEHLEKGNVQYCASDHAPASYAEKHTGSIWTDYSGIPGSGTLWIYLYSKMRTREGFTLSRFLKATGENAAKRFGFFDRKGSLFPGKDADFIILDPEENTVVRGEEFLSKGHITPFENRAFSGKILGTYIRGQKVYDSSRGICCLPGYGQWIKPSSYSRE